ncbi:hypothetical protein HYFRA_00010652 [Hymenoscyphus fraxineus]|uniref:Zn(2)-C6 fungal-type domain-containing protein n=1 Tax=Hymenoscyphus fraxineus TaxID=746836 RepID=A0A9N9PYN6_9HELO|nr:hypothetical protein HYFRA_00010652 [Hymenoscyphus fraxineus]
MTTADDDERLAVTAVQQESPTSRFTAVNGKDQLPQNGSGNVNGPPSRRNSDERANGQPRIVPPGQEKLKISTSTQREDWGAANGDRNPYHQALSHPNTPYPDTDGSHKRKRSDSIGQNTSANTYPHTHPSSTKQTPTTATTTTTDADTPRDQNMPPPSGHPHSYGSESHYHDNDDVPDSAISMLENAPPSAVYGGEPWHSRYQHGHMSDERLSEALRRETQSIDARQREYEDGSPDDDRSANPYDSYGNDRREMSVQSDPKKRKRNFSNRTKTGCMTCRRRKKKCDETKPECTNCLRGGFVCSGYQQRGPWQKTEQKQAPIALQSKTEYEGPAYQSSPYGLGPPPRREPLPGYRGQGLRVDPQHGRPIDVDDDQPSASTLPSVSVTSPDKNRVPTISYSGQTATPITASSSSHPDRLFKKPYETRPGPLHDLSRQETRQEETLTPQSASSNITQIIHPQMSSESPHTNPQVAAQLALANLGSTTRQPTAKELMLAGRHYFPFDKELVLERERCNGSCWRFNGSTNPNNGVSPEERARLFRDILQPKEISSPTGTSVVNPAGRVGDNVVVEAPFNCDYGYNITIGQDVAIGKNCTILDTCQVTIGDRCNIGPNVNIYTTTLPIDPRKRMGSRGLSLGKKVTISNDCWIGGGVIILPGILIGEGSTVGAGSVVTRDVPKYTVVCGNPARVSRGIGT